MTLRVNVASGPSQSSPDPRRIQVALGKVYALLLRRAKEVNLAHLVVGDQRGGIAVQCEEESEE